VRLGELPAVRKSAPPFSPARGGTGDTAERTDCGAGTTAAPVFDMDTNPFFEAVAAELACDRERAETVAFVVLQELRDRLTVKEANDVAAQLPEPLRRAWHEGETPERQPHKVHAAEFIGRVRRRALLPDDREAERAVRAVFRTFHTLLGSTTGLDGESWDVFSVLPKDMKSLWLDLPASERV
jgi:uncharacterized protein (DUF2267 family)